MGKSNKNLSSVTVVGLDIAKNVFQVHGVDAKGATIVARSVRRGQLLSFFASLPRCLVGMEACSSAHHWGRALSELGHEVKLIPPAYVSPMSGAIRTTRSTRRRFAKRWGGRTCASWRFAVSRTRLS
jgi:transposase